MRTGLQARGERVEPAHEIWGHVDCARPKYRLLSVLDLYTGLEPSRRDLLRCCTSHRLLDVDKLNLTPIRMEGSPVSGSELLPALPLRERCETFYYSFVTIKVCRFDGPGHSKV